MIVFRDSTFSKATPMQKTHPSEPDTWLDQEISSLLDSVASRPVGTNSRSGTGAARPMPKASPARTRLFSSAAVRDLGLQLRLRRMTLADLAVAVAVGVLAAWLTVTFTNP
jgi:hypothetical protein